MNSTLKRTVGFGVVSLTAAAAIGLTGGVANAATGALTINPATGGNLSSASVDTPQACDPAATHFQGRIEGLGFQDSSLSPATQGYGYNITSNGFLTSVPNNAAGGKTIALLQTFQSAAESQTPPAPLTGIHTITVRCKNGPASSPIYDSFSIQLDFQRVPGQPLSSTDRTYTVVAAPATATTTTITGATPASPQQAGTSVTFNGTVTAAAGTPAGTVQLKDDGANLGPAVAVAAGAFSITVPAPAAGNNAITAVFTATDPAAFASSTSAAFPYTTTSAPATATSTTLTANPNPALDTDSVVLTATVAPAAAGTVQFKADGTNLGAPVPVAGGTATTSKVFTAGTKSLTASFIPTNPASFDPSTSTPVSLVVTANPQTPTGTDIQYIQGEIPAGTITITTPYTQAAPLDLGVLALNANNSMFSASKPFENIIITDTRAGNLGWVATAKADPLTSGANSINGQNVGLTALVPTYTAGNALQSGVVTSSNPAADPAVAPGAPGTLGLGGIAHTIATAPLGTSIGTVTMNGLLTLNAPTSTPAGIYTGVVTFTVA